MAHVITQVLWVRTGIGEALAGGLLSFMGMPSVGSGLSFAGYMPLVSVSNTASVLSQQAAASTMTWETLTQQHLAQQGYGGGFNTVTSAGGMLLATQKQSIVSKLPPWAQGVIKSPYFAPAVSGLEAAGLTYLQTNNVGQ